jgi:hypothetical protein
MKQILGIISSPVTVLDEFLPERGCYLDKVVNESVSVEVLWENEMCEWERGPH